MVAPLPEKRPTAIAAPSGSPASVAKPTADRLTCRLSTTIAHSSGCPNTAGKSAMAQGCLMHAFAYIWECSLLYPDLSLLLNRLVRAYQAPFPVRCRLAVGPRNAARARPRAVAAARGARAL